MCVRAWGNDNLLPSYGNTRDAAPQDAGAHLAPLITLFLSLRAKLAHQIHRFLHPDEFDVLLLLNMFHGVEKYDYYLGTMLYCVRVPQKEAKALAHFQLTTLPPTV